MASSFGNSAASSSSSSSIIPPSSSSFPPSSSTFNSTTSPCSSSPSFNNPDNNIPVRFLLFIGLLFLVHCADANPLIFPGQNEWEEHRICGRLLINALKTVCNHQYVQPTREQLYDNYYKSTGMLFRARRGSSSSAALVGGGSRRRRGIIFECCTNKCSLNYIRNNYCAQGPSSSDGPIPSWQFVEEASRKRRR